MTETRYAEPEDNDHLQNLQVPARLASAGDEIQEEEAQDLELYEYLRRIAQGQEEVLPDPFVIADSPELLQSWRTYQQQPLSATSWYVSRSAWGARARRNHTTLRDAKGTAFHYVGGPIGSFEHSRCAHLVRGIQNFHMDTRGWFDIAYNFLVCPHGFVFEGRGMGVRSGANGTTVANRERYAVCGLYGEGDPLVDGLKIAFRRATGHITSSSNTGQEITPHSAHRATSCPGNTTRNWINSGAPSPEEVPVPQEPRWRNAVVFDRKGALHDRRLAEAMGAFCVWKVLNTESKDTIGTAHTIGIAHRTFDRSLAQRVVPIYGDTRWLTLDSGFDFMVKYAHQNF